MSFNQQLFIERLKTLRKQSGLSQEQLAKEVNVSRAAMGHWELGNRTPDLNTITLLCDVLNCSVSYILGLSNVKKEILSSPIFDMMFNADLPMFVFSPSKKNSHRFVWVNDAALAQLGYEREEFLNLDPKTICEEICLDTIEEKIRILDEERTLETGWINITKDGKRLLVKQNIHKISTSIQPYYLVINHYISSI